MTTTKTNQNCTRGCENTTSCTLCIVQKILKNFNWKSDAKFLPGYNGLFFQWNWWLNESSNERSWWVCNVVRFLLRTDQRLQRKCDPKNAKTKSELLSKSTQTCSYHLTSTLVGRLKANFTKKLSFVFNKSQTQCSAVYLRKRLREREREKEGIGGNRVFKRER